MRARNYSGLICRLEDVYALLKSLKEGRMEGHRISCKGLVSIITKFSLSQVTSSNKLVLWLENALRSYFMPFILVSG